MPMRMILGGVITLIMAAGLSSTASAVSGYAALGDSVAAGAGLSAGQVSDCDRSSLAYPNLVAKSTGLSLTQLSCSGAKVDEGVYGDQDGITPQLDTAFIGGTPSLMTITIGANDARWTQFLKQCHHLRCGYAVDTARSAAYLADLKIELNIMLAKIHQKSEGNPPVVLVNGYYSPFSSHGCDETDTITKREASWVNGRVAALNRAISGTVSKFSYAKFVPISFKGHDLCSSDPWVQGLQAAAPFHPTAKGQQAIAQANIKKYQQAVKKQSAPSSLREKALGLFN